MEVVSPERDEYTCPRCGDWTMKPGICRCCVTLREILPPQAGRGKGLGALRRELGVGHDQGR